MSERAAFLKALPYERRAKILAQQGNDPEVAKALGIVAPAAAPKAKVRGAGRRVNLSGIMFDSQGEADTYLALRDLFPAVFCHPQVALCSDEPLDDGRRMIPDFIVAIETYPDGTFLAAAIDYKGTRGDRAHAEDDWKVRRSWMLRGTGVFVRVVTKQLIASMRAAMVEGRSIVAELLGEK